MKDLAYYRRLRYTRHVEPDEDETGRHWVAYIEELPGCVIHGATVTEAHNNLDEVFDDYIQAMLDEGLNIPEPSRPVEPAGEPAPPLDPASRMIFRPVDLQTPPPKTSGPDRTEDDSTSQLTVVAA